MSITLNFTAPTESDIASVKVWEADTSAGPFTHVYTEAITILSTSVTYSSGVTTKWYQLTFLDAAGNESLPSVAIYGNGLVWSDYMISIIRTELADWGTNPRYTDLELKKKLVVAAAELDLKGQLYSVFDYTYTISIDGGDGSSWDISGDPVYDEKDSNFLNLWILSVLCSDARQGLSGATSNAIKIKDGDSSIDTAAGFGGYKLLLSDMGGPCAAFAEAWSQLLYSSKNGGTSSTKYVLANFGSDYINRPEVINVNGTIERDG